MNPKELLGAKKIVICESCGIMTYALAEKRGCLMAKEHDSVFVYKLVEDELD